MLPDHYATLGVAPSSRPAAIRAAYVELMRRYHPDKNPSDAHKARVRAITAAYAVLSVPDLRVSYDLERAKLVAAQSPIFMPERPPWRATPLLAAMFGLAVIALLLPFLIPPPFVPPQQTGPTSSVGVGGHEPTAQLEHGQSADRSAPVALCSSPAAAGQIKRELFLRAARLRGSDRATYERLSDYSLIRFDSPPLAKAGPSTVSCEVSVAVSLAPGVTTPSGRSAVTGKIGYLLRADGSYRDTISLITEGSIVRELATLSRASSVTADAADLSAVPEAGAVSEHAKLVEPSPSIAPRATPIQASAETQRPPQQNPSFSCRLAKSWAEMSVCSSAALAAIDRQMAFLHGTSMGRADEHQRALLLQSHARFLSLRDQCTVGSCVYSAYVAQIRGINDIMAGRQPAH